MGKILAYFTMPHPPIIIPEVGRGEEYKIKNTTEACYKVAEEIKSLNPDTIIIITPHALMFGDAIAISNDNNISGDLSNFHAPQVNMNFKVDINLNKKIIKNAQKYDIPIAKLDEEIVEMYNRKYELDHGSIVPLYFIKEKFDDFKLVHINYGLLSDIELYKFGMAIKDAVEESNTNAVFIASGDLSHRLKKEGPYDYSPYGEKFDSEIIQLLKDGDVEGVFNIDHKTIENAGECGLKSYYIMLGAMDGNYIKGELLSYEGTFGVGYGVMRFDLKKSDESIFPKLIDQREKQYEDKLKKEDPYVRLARESLTYYIKNKSFMEVPQYITQEMKKERKGVFVSLKKSQNLRGCIGTILPTRDNIAEEIIRNSVEAGMRDPRFSPVREEELKDIDFSVDVLTDPVKASKDELDPKKFGIIIRSGARSGLLLPNLEGVDTVDEQINITLQKAGIHPSEKYDIEKFEVIRHE